uniref:Uncharacterized protein n=1 Tax=Esox lucius TaxID=8010 RepID=A0A3P8XVY3_ESOLU
VYQLVSVTSSLSLRFSHVVSNFSQCEEFFLNKKTPNIPTILKDGKVQNQTRYKPICQKYQNTYRFATLYDTTNRIPVFSAYKFTGAVKGRPSQAWMIEPQAVDADYEKNNLSMDRGHLLPCQYAADIDAKKSTFTLTNAVPQASSFNRVSWRKMECSVKKILESNCIDANGKLKANLVTGAVPGNNYLNKVNIPSSMWTAFCCYNRNTKKWIAQGYWGKNEKSVKPPLITLKDLEEELAKAYSTNPNPVKVFPDECPRNVKDIKRKRRLVKEVEGDKDRKRQREEMDDCGEGDEFDCDDVNECDCECNDVRMNECDDV